MKHVHFVAGSVHAILETGGGVLRQVLGAVWFADWRGDTAVVDYQQDRVAIFIRVWQISLHA